jgi:hypothetical protein
MYESIYKNNEVENEVTLDMSYFWYSDAVLGWLTNTEHHTVQLPTSRVILLNRILASLANIYSAALSS